MEHALSCSHGEFPSIHHNELRDITAELMSQVCHNVGTEPSLQPITGEHLIHRIANREDDSWLDVAAGSFWGNYRQCTFFDIRVFNSFAPSYQNTPLAQCDQKNELEKNKPTTNKWEKLNMDRSRHVFTTTGDMGAVATVVYKWLAAMIAGKTWEALQQNHAVDQKPIVFFATAFCYHVPSWIPVFMTPPCSSSQCH